MAEEKMNFYRSFYDAGRALGRRDRMALYDAMLAFFFDGAEPEGLSPVASAVFGVARGRIEKSRTNAGNVRTRYAREPKRTGTRVDASQSVGYETAYEKRSRSQSVGYETAYEKRSRSQSVGYEKRDSYRPEGEGEGDREETPTESVGVSGRAPCASAPRGRAPDPLGEPSPSLPYRPPTPSEVSAFLAASGAHPIDAERFCRWHDDRGWPPRGWQGTALNWANSERERQAGRSARAGGKGAGDARDEYSRV